jgi:hypothetical protein
VQAANRRLCSFPRRLLSFPCVSASDA